jgi:hypothetical protein
MRKKVWLGLVALLFLAALMTGIGVQVYSSFDNPYRDGYNYASQFIAGGSQFRGCHRDAMIYDAHEPNDDYSQWAAGCRAEAMILNSTGTPGNNGALGRKPRLIY